MGGKLIFDSFASFLVTAGVRASGSEKINQLNLVQLIRFSLARLRWLSSCRPQHHVALRSKSSRSYVHRTNTLELHLPPPPRRGASVQLRAEQAVRDVVLVMLLT